MFLIFILSALHFTSTVNAAIRYPVRELGNCRNQTECKLYCEIPKNTPACWSYGKCVLNGNVLGEQTTDPKKWAAGHNIVFPIKELGNCKSVSECKEFCSLEANKDACATFAKKFKILKTKKEKITPAILKAAGEMLGCTNKEDCKKMCELPENKDKCRMFGLKYQLIIASLSGTPYPTKPAVSVTPKNSLSCGDNDKCIKYCLEFPAECPGLTPGAPDAIYIGPGGCKTDEQCEKYCKKFPSSCPGYSKTKGFSDIEPSPKPTKAVKDKKPIELEVTKAVKTPTPITEE